jgi:hypothetical protein
MGGARLEFSLNPPKETSDQTIADTRKAVRFAGAREGSILTRIAAESKQLSVKWRVIG